MCLIGIAYRTHAKHELVLAANRDEFHDRPSASAAAWADHPHIFGGRDLRQKGSWLAVSATGRVAAITNVRRMVPPDPLAPSRGLLVADYFAGAQTPGGYLAQLGAAAPAYAGFNLLIGTGTQAHYATNHPQFRSAALARGVHAVSNASLDTPWPKLNRLRATLARWCAQGRDEFDDLFAALADERPAVDSELPDTGIGLEMERFLSPPFIRSARYGTRASTVLAMAADGRTHFVERRFGANGASAGETHRELNLNAAN